MKNINKKDLFRGILSVLIVGVMIFAAVLIVNYEPEIKTTVIEHDSSSELLSTDPMISAANFIYANGNIGDITEDVNERTLINGEADYSAVQRRQEALELVKEAVIPGNLIISGSEDNFIKTLIGKFDTPIFHEVKNVTASEPVNQGKLEVYSDTGNAVYDFVDVFVSFDSYKVWYQWGRDADWDGTVQEIENKEHFEDIRVSLVKSGDLWFIYDIEDSEYKVNSRFATWNGIGEETYGPEDQVRREIMTTSPE